MATLNLGRIKPVFRGAYNNSTAYVVDDIVTSSGSSYICILASTGNAVSNATYWTQMSSAGTNGTDLTSTLTTQGDIVYRSGSGLARLGYGTAGQVLQTGGSGANPSWGTVSSDFVKIKTQTVTLSDGVTYVDFVHGTSGVVFDGTYNTYKFIMSRFAPQNAVDIQAQVLISGTAQTSGYITEAYRSYYSGGSGRANVTTSITRASYGMHGSSVVNQSVGLSEFTTTNPSISQYPQVMAQHSGAENNQMITSHCAGKWQTTTTNWNGMRFFPASGNFEGTITLYGLKG